MENAAMAAYLKDVEGNNVDLTAEQIIRDKMNRPEKIEPEENPNRMPPAAPESHPRFNPARNRDRDVDPCDTYAHVKRNSQHKFGPTIPTTSTENRGRTKPERSTKDKKKVKKMQDDDRSQQPKSQKFWYEARCPQGTYYWHIETNESSWEPPEEGFMTVEEQEDEVKEQAIQAEFLEQIEKEQAKEKAERLEEQRANNEREKLRELRKRRNNREERNGEGESSGSKVERARGEFEKGREKQNVKVKNEEEEKEEEEEDNEDKIPYRRDYSVPEKPDPYGPWQTVQIIPRKVVDLQLPKKKATVDVPSLKNRDQPHVERIFVEKTVTRLTTSDSDDERIPTTFKKRRFGVKNVRKRFDDD